MVLHLETKALLRARSLKAMFDIYLSFMYSKDR